MAEIAALGENNKETKIKVQFNPSEYSTAYSVNYASQKNVSGNKNAKQFTGADDASMKFKLTLDGFTKAHMADPSKAIIYDPEKADDILKDAEFFRSFTAIDEKLHKPPKCRFTWGSFSFTGSVEHVDINFTMFASTGKPIRATVDLTIKNTESKPVAKASPDRTERVVPPQGTPLYMVAYEAYGDPEQWRGIAAANGIRNPRKFRAGTVLRVPPLEFK